MIQAHTDRAIQILPVPMRIDHARADRVDGGLAYAASQFAGLPTGLSGDIVLTVSPVELLAPVLGRIGRALAPSAGFSLDRCADVYLVTDALGAHAERAAESTSISVALGARDQLLEFAVSPLRAGTSRRLDGPARGLERPESLASLTDELTVSEAGGHELLRVAMRDHRRS